MEAGRTGFVRWPPRGVVLSLAPSSAWPCAAIAHVRAQAAARATGGRDAGESGVRSQGALAWSLRQLARVLLSALVCLRCASSLRVLVSGLNRLLRNSHTVSVSLT